MPAMPRANTRSRFATTFDFMSLHRVAATFEASADRTLVVGGLLFEPRALRLRRVVLAGSVLRLLRAPRSRGSTDGAPADAPDDRARRGVVRAADGGADHRTGHRTDDGV